MKAYAQMSHHSGSQIMARYMRGPIWLCTHAKVMRCHCMLNAAHSDDQTLPPAAMLAVAAKALAARGVLAIVMMFTVTSRLLPQSLWLMQRLQHLMLPSLSKLLQMPCKALSLAFISKQQTMQQVPAVALVSRGAQYNCLTL